jgi:Fe-S cluster assembly protein SufD
MVKVSTPASVKEKENGSYKEDYLAAFQSFEKIAGIKKPDWIHSLRSKAIACFADLGFPAAREEDWKYTSVAPIAKNTFRFLLEPGVSELSIEKIEPFLFGQKNWNRLVFVNGFYSKTLSHTPNLNGVVIGNLAEALGKDSKIIEPHLTRYASYNQNGFVALNTAFLCHGAFVYLPKGMTAAEPIHCLFLSLPGKSTIISQPRNLIVAGEGSRATLIETYASLADESYFNNAVTEIILGNGANLEHYKIQKESRNAFHIATTQVQQERASTFVSHSISLGGSLVRNDLHVILANEGDACTLNGLYLAAGRQHVDNHTLIDHTRPHGTSHQLYKGVLQGKSRAVFNGKVFVRRDAQKTDAEQTNKNLLLSEQATVDTKPQLEIFADDVKCTHGAAVGYLEEEAIFYLKSRGVGERNARKMLTYGFAREVIHHVKIEPIRAQLDEWLSQWLEKESSDEALHE